jgi:hypothetical protein
MFAKVVSATGNATVAISVANTCCMSEDQRSRSSNNVGSKIYYRVHKAILEQAALRPYAFHRHTALGNPNRSKGAATFAWHYRHFRDHRLALNRLLTSPYNDGVTSSGSSSYDPLLESRSLRIKFFRSFGFRGISLRF